MASNQKGGRGSEVAQRDCGLYGWFQSGCGHLVQILRDCRALAQLTSVTAVGAGVPGGARAVGAEQMLVADVSHRATASQRAGQALRAAKQTQ